MSYTRGNMTFKRPRNPDLKIPGTKSEFLKLGYNDRVQLLKEHPDVYKRFTEPEKKPWE